MQIPTPHFEFTVNAGTILLSSAILVAVWKIARVAKLLITPIREFINEHDILWEDYNLRTGGSYRRTAGRGAPPEPEEWYREHPLARKDDSQL